MYLNLLCQKINDLFHYCIRTGDWEPELDCRPLLAFADEASKHKQIVSNWEAMTAYDLILIMLDNHKERILRGVDSTLCKEFVEKFIKYLSRHRASHLIVLPILKTTADSVIEFNRFSVIPYSLSRDEKISILAKKTNRSFESTENLAKHTEKSRSPNFYNNTLFCIKITHQTNWINMKARQIALWNIAFLRALHYGLEYRKPSLLFGRFVPGPENKHMLIISKQDWRCSHLPLDFNASCSFSLEWLRKENVQQRLVRLNNLLVFPDVLDRLSYRFFRSFRLFSKSIDFIEMNEAFEGIGLSILFLMIAAEGVLLDRESEKRVRLSSLLPKFGCPPRISRSHAYNTVNDCYQWRSDFVHSGTDKFPDYDEDFKEGKHQKEFNLLRKMVARMLLNCPRYINRAKQRVKRITGSKKNLDKYEAEKEWFNYLRERWERSLIF